MMKLGGGCREGGGEGGGRENGGDALRRFRVRERAHDGGVDLIHFTRLFLKGDDQRADPRIGVEGGTFIKHERGDESRACGFLNQPRAFEQNLSRRVASFFLQERARVFYFFVRGTRNHK